MKEGKQTKASAKGGKGCSKPAEEEGYYVEKVIGKRVKNGILKYKIKWLGYSSSENTWEPMENLKGSEEFVEEFEKKQEQKARKRTKEKQTDVNGSSSKKSTQDQISGGKVPDLSIGEMKDDENEDVHMLTSIPFGKIPRKILGATYYKGSLALLVELESTYRFKEDGLNVEQEQDREEDYHLISSKAMNLAYPQLVIGFYQSNIKFSTVEVEKQVTQSTIRVESDVAKHKQRREAVEFLANNHTDELLMDRVNEKLVARTVEEKVGKETVNGDVNTGGGA